MWCEYLCTIAISCSQSQLVFLFTKNVAVSDSRLNSVHLIHTRREEFRQARKVLIQACGQNTQAQAGPFTPEQARSSQTLMDRESQALAGMPKDLHCWLVDEEHLYPLKIGLNTVGRSSDNDVVIRDGYVSRRHCTLLVHSDFRCELHDTASKNGTFINGKKMARPTPLRKGDKIRMCDCTLTFMSSLEESPDDSRFSTCTIHPN